MDGEFISYAVLLSVTTYAWMRTLRHIKLMRLQALREKAEQATAHAEDLTRQNEFLLSKVREHEQALKDSTALVAALAKQVDEPEPERNEAGQIVLGGRYPEVQDEPLAPPPVIPQPGEEQDPDLECDCGSCYADSVVDESPRLPMACRRCGNAMWAVEYVQNAGLCQSCNMADAVQANSIADAYRQYYTTPHERLSAEPFTYTSVADPIAARAKPQDGDVWAPPEGPRKVWRDGRWINPEVTTGEQAWHY